MVTSSHLKTLDMVSFISIPKMVKSIRLGNVVNVIVASSENIIINLKITLINSHSSSNHGRT